MPDTPRRRPTAASRPPGQTSECPDPDAPDPLRPRDPEEVPDPEELPVIRISSMTELVRIVPHQVGFMPTESLVVQCLDAGRASRAMRVDLPVAQDEWQRELELAGLCAHLAAQLDPERDCCLVVIYSRDPTAVVLAAQVRAMFQLRGRTVLATAVVDQHEILTISAAGEISDRKPIDRPDSAAITALKAAHALSGRRTLADRSELSASIAPPLGIGASIGRRAVVTVEQELRPVAPRDGGMPVADQLLRSVLQDVLTEVAGDGLVQVGTAARLAVYCWDPIGRDTLLTRMLERRSEPWVPALMSALRRLPAGDSADLCSVLVVLAYRGGDGALAQVAADRVLSTDHHHRLTLLMLDIMFAGLPPETLDGMGSGAT